MRTRFRRDKPELSGQSRKSRRTRTLSKRCCRWDSFPSLPCRTESLSVLVRVRMRRALRRCLAPSRTCRCRQKRGAEWARWLRAPAHAASQCLQSLRTRPSLHANTIIRLTEAAKKTTDLPLCKFIKFFARTTFHCKIRIAQATADRPQSSGGDGWWAPDLVRGCRRLEK